MLAFATRDGEPVQYREVNLPDIFDNVVGEGILKHIFYYGQNDFQPKEMPSLSAGDVIEVGEERYLIENAGFKLLTADELKSYTEMPRTQRMMYLFTGKPVRER